MSLAAKLEGDNLQLVCQRSVEELHSLFVAWFQGTAPREGLTTSLMECLAPDFSHVAPNGQFLQGRGTLIGHLQDKYGCYKNRLFQIEIYDVRLLWHDEPGNKCLCTYEEWQSWLPDTTATATATTTTANSAQPQTTTVHSEEGSSSEDDEGGVHQFGRLSTCLLERKRNNNNSNSNNNNNSSSNNSDSKYRWIHVHETWLEAESPQHEKQSTAGVRGTSADLASFMGEDTVATGPMEYRAPPPPPPNNNNNNNPMLSPNSKKVKQHKQQQQNNHESSSTTSSSEGTAGATPPPPLSSSSRDMPVPESGDSGGTKRQQSDPDKMEEKREEASSEMEDDDDDQDDDEDPSSSSDDDEEEEDDEDFSGEHNPNERHLLMLMSTQSLSRDQISHQNQARTALESSGIAFYEMDGANPEERENRNSLFQLSGQWGRYPQFFLVDTAGSTTFWGDWNFFYASHRQGLLLAHINQNNNNGNGGENSTSNSGAELSPVVVMAEAPDALSSSTPSAAVVAVPAATARSAAATTETATTTTSTTKASRPKQLSNNNNTTASKNQAPPPLPKSASNTKPTTAVEVSAPPPPAPPTTTTMQTQKQVQNESSRSSSMPALPQAQTTDATLVLLISTQTLSRDQSFRQSEVIRVLDGNGIVYETIDGSDKTSRERRNQLFRISTLWGKYPQIFHDKQGDAPATFWGTWDELQNSMARNTVVKDLQYVRPPTLARPWKNESPSSSSNHNIRDEPAAEPAVQVPVVKQPSGGSVLQFEAGSVLFLISTQALSKEQMIKQSTAMEMLQEANLGPPRLIELDGAARDYRQQRNELFKVSKLWGRYPQLFVIIAGADNNNKAGKELVFWGDYEHMELCHNEGTLRSCIFEALGMPDDESIRNEQKNGVAQAASQEISEDDIFEKKKSPEEEFMEKSQGILEFEPDDGSEEEEEDDDDENDEAHGYRGSSNNNNNKHALVVSKRKPENDELVLKAEEEKLLEVTAVVSPIPQDVSSKRHVSSKLLKYAKPLTWENSLVGLSLHGFDIGTSQGPIADETWYKEVTEALESVAQYRGGSKKTPHRKLTLPEMVFPTAHVAIEGHGFWLSWDVLDALEEWARAHADIPIGSSDSHNGVGVVKSQDAKLWEKNKKKMGAAASTGGTTSPTVFHYDWSFSSPFAGKVEGGEWVELDESGMKAELLTDTTVPILFFDEITLFEDDLHDNGQVQFTVKIRVMPSCAYVLARLWLRVDNVLVRVRETRLLVDFFGMTPVLYRDVTWRECWWESFKLHKLPNDVRSWHFDGTETPEWQKLLRKIPEVQPPPGIMQFATLEPTKQSRQVVRQLNSSVAEALSTGNASGYLEL